MKNRALTIAAVVLVAISIGLGVYISQRIGSPIREPEAPPTAQREPTPPPTEEKTREVKVFRVVVENNEPRLKSSVQSVPDGDPIRSALSKLVEQGSNGGTVNPIPKGTKLLGVEVKDGLAKVDFSREFRDNFAGGSEGEALVIAVILRTMDQFDEVKKVQILVEGKPIDSLGHADLSEPLDVGWVSPEFSGE